MSLGDTNFCGSHGNEPCQKVTPVTLGARFFPMPEKPIVTIITPTFNRALFLEDTIRSVLSQDYEEIEYIILDDGSTDDTPRVLGKYCRCARVKVLSHENMGETRTVNKGFSLATGDIICVVNSDDPLLPGAIRESVRYMRCHPEVLAAYPDWIEIDQHGKEVARRGLPYYSIEKMLLDFNVAMGPGTFIRREAFDLIGYRNPTLKYTGDLDFWFRLAEVAPLGHMSEFLATHRSHPNAATFSGRGAVMADEIVRLVQNAYTSKALSEKLIRGRFRAYFLAHYTAAHQCGGEILTCLKHCILAVTYGGCHLVRRLLSY